MVKHNPEIDWQTGEVKMSCCPDLCGNRPASAQWLKEATPKSKKGLTQPLTQREQTFILFVEDEGREHIDATYTVSQQLAKRTVKTGPTKSFEDLVPKEYWEFQDIFLKKSFDQLPARKPWDHVIELTPGSQPFSTKVYPTSPNEQQELNVFLEENLKTHQICPSKSPMASPVFFVKKKDGSLQFV